MSWASCLIGSFAICGLAVIAGYVLINLFAEGLTRFILGLVGWRGVELAIGVPFFLFAGWSLGGLPHRRLALNMQPMQVMIGAVVALVIGALGVALIIFAIAGEGEPKGRSSF